MAGNNYQICDAAGAYRMLPDIPVTEAAPGKEDPYPEKSYRSGYPPKQVTAENTRSTF